MAKKKRKIQIYSALEVANLCGVVNQTAINWIKSGYLKAFTTPGGQYRVYADELALFLRSQNMRLPNELKAFIQESLSIKEKTLLLGVVEEQDNSLLDFLKEKLSNYHTIQVRTSFDLGCYLYKFNPYIIILDWDAFGSECMEICKKIKENKTEPTPFIIALKAKTELSSADAPSKNGIDVFLDKPYDTEELVTIVKKLEVSPEGKKS